jgi:hypothetical protein
MFCTLSLIPHPTVRYWIYVGMIWYGVVWHGMEWRACAFVYVCMYVLRKLIIFPLQRSS